MSKTRMGKRVASLLLSLVMMLSLLPTTVYAEGADTGDTTDEIVGQATTSGDNTEGTGEPEPTGEGEDGAATNDAVVEETIAPVNAEGVDAVANAESSGDEEPGVEGNEATSFVTVNGGTTQYATLEEAIAAAEPVNGVITYTINGKVEVIAAGWVQVAKAGLTGLTKVAFVGATDNAKICITGELAILADQNYDIDVSFESLTLSKPNPAYGGDYGHSTNYFTTWLRNSSAAENTVTYTNCTFPNGVSNNQYGKTVFDNCKFTNGATGLYNLWVYGGNVELNGGTFTGTRGAKVYTEGTPETVPAVTIKDTSFDVLTEKAAIVVSKAATVTLTNVSATDCNKGLFQKAIEGSSNKEEVVIAPSGTNVSGTFVVDGNKGVSEADKRNFNISAGTFTSKVSSEYLAEGLTIGEDGTVTPATTNAVAQIGETTYETLAKAFAAANAGDTVTLLADTTEDVTIDKNITLDLGGKTISSTAYRTIQLNAGADLTVKDSASVGKITNAYTGNRYPSTIYLSGAGAKFTLESGTIESDPNETSLQSVAINSEKNRACEVNIRGGSVTVPEAATQGRAIVASTNSMTLNISGGTIAGGLHGVDAYSGSNVTITDGEITARAVDTGVIKEAYGMRLIGTANVTVAGGTITGVKMDDSGYKGDVPAVKLKSGTIKGSFYSISTGTIIFDVAENADIVLENKSAAKFLPDTVELVEKENGTYGVKKGSYVAQIGETTYATLEAAIAAAKPGATITLLVDLDLSATGLTIAANKDVTLDLNGKTLKLANTNSGNIKVFGKLTLQDITDTAKNGTGTGKVWTETSYIPGEQDKVLIAAINGGTFIMESGLIDAASFTTDNDNDGQFAVSVQNENADATVIINGGCIKAGWYAIAGNGQDIKYNGNITVNGGILESTADYAIYHPHSGTTTINGGVVFGAAGGVSLNRGKLIVNNGIITSKGTGTTGDWGDGTGNQNAAAINVNAQYGSTSVEIKGGKITAEKDAILLTNGKDGTIKVSGGTFNSAVMPEYCAAGYIPTKNEDGSYGVREANYVAQVLDKNGNPVGVKYETLQAAIDAAKRNGTVKMLADTKENVTISTPYLTLDLNGFTLNGSTGERKPALTITARVTVMDSSEAKTGTIMREDTAENSGVSSHYVIDIQGAGWLTFESGNVKNDSGAGGTKGASLVRVGDDSVDKYPGLNIKGGTFTQNNFIVIKVDSGDLFLNGGTLNSTDSYAIEDWHRATIKGGTVNGTVAAWTYSGGHNSDLTISGGTVNGNVESVSYDGAAGKKASVSITGGVVNGMLSTHIYNKETEPSKDIATIAVTGGTFSSDPTKYVVEDSAITPNADGTYGVAKAYLARIGETFYYTMEDAFQAQTNGDTIVLLRDYTTGGTFNSGSINRTVDLNDHTWTCTGTDANSAAFEINYPNASLTVKNGKIVSSQLVGLIPSASGGTITYDNSSLTFENVKMSTTATSGIETNGNNTSDAVTLKDSTLNVPNGFGIYFPSSGTLTIDNSTITAKTMGVQVCAGSLSISGDQTAITVSGDAVPKTENDGAIQDGAAISIVNRPGYKGLGDVTVTGGTFKANGTNVAIKAYDWDNTNNVEKTFTANDKVFVSGGSFNSAVPEGLCKDGYISVANGDGTYTVKKGTYVAQVGSTKYESLAAAIGAAQDSDTVTLLKDIDLPATAVVKGKTITLDLNGKTISNSTDIWNESKYAWSLISVRDNGDLTINDTTGGGTLKAKENDCFALDVYAYDTKNVEDTKLTINAGNYVGNISAVYAFTGKATINGGHFSIQQKESGSDPYRLTLNCYDSSYTAGRAGFTVNGGTFENFDPRNNPAEGAGTSFVAEGVGVNNENGNFTAVPNMAAQRIAADGSSVEAYATLADAIAAAQDGQTVMLLADVTENVEIAANKNLTLDLGGKTLNGGTGTAKAALTNYGTITIRDTSAAKAGTIKRDDNGIPGETSYYVILNQGTMTIEGGNVINNSGYRKTNPSGSMVGSSLICNGDCDEGGTLTIKGGTFTQNNFIAIKNGTLGVLYVTGGTITSEHSAIQNWYKADITGGGIKGQLWTDAWKWKEGESVGETKIGGNAKFTGEIVMDISSSGVVPTLAINGGNLDVTNWRITTAAAKAGAKPAVSGGTFSSKVPAEYCAPGYVPTGEGADGRFTVAEGEFTVQVTSRTVSSESPVANVSGGGSNITYAVGTTVTAASLSGYKFVGWFVNEYTDKSKAVSPNLSFAYNPTADCKLIAVYEPISGAKFYLTVNASEFTVGESAVYDSYMHDQVAAGESVTVTFMGAPENFLYWVNASRKVVSTNPVYTFIMGSETTLSAVYGKTREAQGTVVFMSDSDQIITSKAYKSTDSIQFPTPPIKMGCTFEAWSMTEKAIQAAIAASNNSVIVVKACYTDPSTPYTVTVLYPDDIEAETIQGVVGKTVTVTAKEISGKTFSCWKDDNGNVLGYTKTLMLAPSGNITVKAVYADTAVTVLPTITMTDVSATTQGDKFVVTFMATRSVPDEYKVVKQGILWSRSEACAADDAEDFMQFDSEGKRPNGVNSYDGNNTEKIGVTRCDITTSYANRTFYGRGYMILQDTNGKLLYYYTGIQPGSYDNLTKANGGN